jgi:hypothetical protein
MNRVIFILLICEVISQFMGCKVIIELSFRSIDLIALWALILSDYSWRTCGFSSALMFICEFLDDLVMASWANHRMQLCYFLFHVVAQFVMPLISSVLLRVHGKSWLLLHNLRWLWDVEVLERWKALLRWWVGSLISLFLSFMMKLMSDNILSRKYYATITWYELNYHKLHLIFSGSISFWGGLRLQ